MTNSNQTLKLTNDFAKQYDQHVLSCNWTGPEVLFKLLQPFVKQGDTLLDIGIGTGLASIPFYNAGLKVYGIDGSEEMLTICKSKNIAEKLIQTNICEYDFEIPNVQFDCIISHGVFHMVEDISHIIETATRHLKPEGLICFTVIPYNSDEENEFVETSIPGVYSFLNQKINLLVFRHNISYIHHVLKLHKLQLIKHQIFLAFNDIRENRKVFFEYYLAKKD